MSGGGGSANRTKLHGGMSSATSGRFERRQLARESVILWAGIPGRARLRAWIASALSRSSGTVADILAHCDCRDRVENTEVGLCVRAVAATAPAVGTGSHNQPSRNGARLPASGSAGLSSKSWRRSSAPVRISRHAATQPHRRSGSRYPPRGRQGVPLHGVCSGGSTARVQ